MRTCRDLGLRTVAVYSDIDRTAPHVRFADAAFPIGGAAPAESYLNGDRIIAVAKRSGAGAIHPGYGFLSENAAFAQAVDDAGLIFIGPAAAVQRALGEKTSARRLASDAGVPVAAGTPEPVSEEAAARAAAERIGYPVLLKPAGGGGGKGMRIVRSADELSAAWRGSTGEAQTGFGDARILIERLITDARHVEVQIVADRQGAVVWLGERDCSIQRRHQKLIEETPGPSVTPELRAQLGESAVRIARAAGYTSVGTAEFLVSPDGSFVFLEMNTRLQVEHPVTEMVTGLDLVALQLRIAAGDPLPFGQEGIRPAGAAIELRITAEDPYAGFLPAGGRITFVREPLGPGVRVDSALASGMTVPNEYDPLLAKIIVWGPTRAAAIVRARRAVRETIIAGIPTALPFHAHTLGEPDFTAGRYDTGYVASHWADPRPPDPGDAAARAAALIAVGLQRRPAAPGAGPAPSAWTQAARDEARR